MATVSTDPGVLSAARANVRRFYWYRFFAFFQLWMPTWMIYLLDGRGLSLTQVLVLDALFAIMTLGFEVPTGAIADRWGRKRSMLLGAMGVSVAVLLFAMSTTFWAVLGSYAVWAAFGTLTSGADVAFLHDSLAIQGREGEFSRAVARGNAAAVGAVALSAMVGAPLAAMTTLELPIYLSVVVWGAAAVTVMRFHDFAPAQAAEHKRYTTLLHDAFQHVARHRRLRLALATNACMQGLGFSAVILAQPFLAHHGVELAYFGVVLAPLALVSMSGALMSHRLEGRLGGRLTVAFAVTGATVSLLMLGLVPSVAAVLVFATLRFSLAVFVPIASDAINRDSPDAVRATIASMGMMSIGVVEAALKPLMGAAAGAWQFEAAFLVAGVPLLVLGGLSTWLWLRLAPPSADALRAVAPAGTAARV